MKTEFPLQQGALDDLCSVYAIVNFLHLACEEKIDLEKSAEVFRRGIKAVSKNEADHKGKQGTLKGLLVGGIKAKNFGWLYKVSIGKLLAPSLKDKKSLTGVNLPAIIYFKVDPSPIENFTHYSVVKAVNEDGDLSLFDSYGLSSIIHVNQRYFLLHDDGSRGEVFLEGIWTIST